MIQHTAILVQPSKKANSNWNMGISIVDIAADPLRSHSIPECV